MKFLICGGRDFADQEFFDQAMQILRERYPITRIIHGGQRGADAMAGDWVNRDGGGIPVSIYFADWQLLGPYAGNVRNQRMIDEGEPDMVVAFLGGKGTRDMCRRAYEAGIPVWHTYDEDEPPDLDDL